MRRLTGRNDPVAPALKMPDKKLPIFVYLVIRLTYKDRLLDWTDANIVESIKSGEEEGLIHLYRTLREGFVKWAGKRYGVDDDLLNDAFQEAIIALRHNVIHDRWVQGSSSLKTYLFSIGKNQLLGRLKRTKYESSKSDMIGVTMHIKGQENELTDRQILVRNQIGVMADPCKSILKMFYYLGYSMEVIAARMAYKNEDVAKSQKMRCLKKLKQRIATTQNAAR